MRERVAAVGRSLLVSRGVSKSRWCGSSSWESTVAAGVAVAAPGAAGAGAAGTVMLVRGDGEGEGLGAVKEGTGADAGGAAFRDVGAGAPATGGAGLIAVSLVRGVFSLPLVGRAGSGGGGGEEAAGSGAGAAMLEVKRRRSQRCSINQSIRETGR